MRDARCEMRSSDLESRTANLASSSVRAAQREARGQVAREFHLERLVRRHLHVIDLVLDASAPDLRNELVDFLEVRLAQRAGIDKESGVFLEPLEHRHALERKADLVLVEHVEDDHVLPAVAEMLQRPK